MRFTPLTPSIRRLYLLLVFLVGCFTVGISGQEVRDEGGKLELSSISELKETFNHFINTRDYTNIASTGLRLKDAALASGENHQDLILETYHQLLYSYHHRNLIDSALLIFREAVDYGEAQPPNWHMSDIYLRGSYLMEGAESKRLVDQSYQNALLLKDTSALAYLHFHYSQILTNENEPEDSIRFHLNKGALLYNLINDTEGFLLTKSQEASWNAAQGRTELALSGFTTVYRNCGASSFTNGYCNTCEYNIGEQLYILGALDSAHWYTEQCLRRAKDRNDYGVIADCHDLLAKISEQERDFERALQHKRKYYQFAEQVHTSATQTAIAAEKVRQNNEAAVEAREKAELEAQLLAAANRQYRTIGFGLLGILLLGGGLLWQLNRTRQSLARSNAELDAINQTKDKFFGLIAHDLQGPVIALGTVGGQLKHLLTNNNITEALDTAEQVQHSSQRLSRLLDNLLKWALVKKGMIPYKPEHLDLAALTNESIALFQNSADLKGVALSSAIRGGLSTYADPRAVSTVLRNLINNALKFTPAGGTVRISARTVSGGIEVEVSDDGIGIPPKKLAALFKLASGSSFGTAGEKGTGLGLVLCQELVELNGGSIRAESIVGRGTEFTVVWPTKGLPK